MLIDDLIEYCDEQYQNGICEACTARRTAYVRWNI